jgi:hypothetical protein
VRPLRSSPRSVRVPEDHRPRRNREACRFSETGTAVAISPEDVREHFGWLGGFLVTDAPASTTPTRDLMGWEPTHPSLLDDLDHGHYLDAAARLTS